VSNRSILGFAALACVACCIGPILVVFGAIAALGLASTMFIGAAGFVIAAAAVALFVVVRRRRIVACATAAEPVPVALSRREL
jgi:hypothetical protein